MTLSLYKIEPPTAAGRGIKDIAEALSEDGPLEVEPAHILNILMPDALDASTAADKIRGPIYGA